MRRLLGLLSLGLTLMTACAAPPPRAPREPGPGEAAVRVLTYNVNYGIAGDAETLDAIVRADADIVALQETSAAWEQGLRAKLGKQYPFMRFLHRGGAGGMAILARVEPESVDFIRPTGDGWFPAVRVVARTPIGRVQILSVHLRPPFSDGGSLVVGYLSTPSVRRQEIADFTADLDSALPTLVVGDFNEEPDGGVTKVLKAKGFTSALPAFAPDTPTWRWGTSVGTFRRQLDHVVHDARLEPLSVTVIQAGQSDHLPVLAVVRRAKGR